MGFANRGIGIGLGGAVVAMALMGAATEPVPQAGDWRGREKPRPKSPHKRKFKGSKAAKKAHRRHK